MVQYISVTEVLKLVCPFKGDKREVLAFISNVDMAFEVTDPEQAHILYRFVLTRISGEPRTAITYRNLENWELKAFLKNTYTEKRTLDYHATQLFGARQGKKIAFRNASKTFRSSVQNSGRQHYRTARKTNVWE